MLKEHERTTNRICWNAKDPNELLSASQDATIKLWVRTLLPLLYSSPSFLSTLCNALSWLECAKVSGGGQPPGAVLLELVGVWFSPIVSVAAGPPRVGAE